MGRERKMEDPSAQALPSRKSSGPPKGWTASKASTMYNKFLEEKTGIKDYGGGGAGGGGPSLPFRIIDLCSKPHALGSHVQYCMTRARPESYTGEGNKVDVLEFGPHT